MTTISKFISKVQAVYETGTATEHSYRPALQALFDTIDPDVCAQNEPRRVEVGAPDFVFTRNGVTIGHAEAKDLGHDLKGLKGREKDQFDRYRKAFPNLLYTDGLTFLFYRDGELLHEVRIGDLHIGLRFDPTAFAALGNALRDFVAQSPLSITRPDDLAKRMAGKTSLIKDVLSRTLIRDTDRTSNLAQQYTAFRKQLINDMSVDDFAGMYAETIAYGMFAARLHDDTLDTFSRHEAMERLPKSNPFLRNLFNEIAGPKLDEEIRWVIDDLVDIFRATDPKKIVAGFGKLTGRNDPFLHFYETFLAAYDPKKRKARGVWYTPQSVVNFIVRTVDDVLRSEFGLSDGLADTSKVRVRLETGQRERTAKGQFRKDGRMGTIEKEVHRVQILDPATGTGTFLAEVIRQIAPRIQSVAPGMWNSYVEQELIPRLHGFELLMASYAMCHLKLDMMLSEMGYVPTRSLPRLSVYLTNSLEEGDPIDQTLPFAEWLSDESRAANEVKRDMPIMCIIGNPPYNPSSANDGLWINRMMADYKIGLNERKINLNDDYMKFIRLAEHYIERNDKGVLAFITNNSYLDGASKRVMRKRLALTFDRIIIVNLHGDTRTDAPSIDDENVFDIMQGVAIIIAVRNGRKDRKEIEQIEYASISGRRIYKDATLKTLTIESPSFEKMELTGPSFRMLPSKSKSDEYESGFQLNSFYKQYSSGIQTKRDAVCVSVSKKILERTIEDFLNLPPEKIRGKYRLPKDGRDWTLSNAIADIKLQDGEIVPFLYKPFDSRFIYYSGRTKGFVAYPRRAIMDNIVGKKNVSLIFNRQNVRDYFSYVGVTNVACCHGTFYLGNRGQDYVAPLYLHPAEGSHDEVRPNFDPKLHRKLLKIATDDAHGAPSPEDIFDYIYAVLHCPAYRDTYAEFLRIDFPRIPWPKTPADFWRLVPQGSALRRLHLMEPTAIGDTPYPFVGGGDNVVGKPCYEEGHVWINASQRFSNTPAVSWTLPIGGYQPAQKWLKDREGCVLSFDDVKHYQKIIKILAETDRIMEEIVMPLATPAQQI